MARVLYGKGVHANGDSFRLYDLSFLAATQQNSVKQRNKAGSGIADERQMRCKRKKGAPTHTQATRGNMRRRTIKHKVNRRTVARWTHRDWLLSFACPMSPRRHRAPKIKRRRRCEMFFPLAIARHRTNCNFASFSTNKTTIVRSHLLLFYCHFLEKVPRTQYLHVRLLKFSFICPLPPFRFILFARCWVRRMRTRVCVLVATEDFRRQFFFASPSESCWRVLVVCVWINAFDICLQRRNFRTLLHLVSLFFCCCCSSVSCVSFAATAVWHKRRQLLRRIRYIYDSTDSRTKD